MTGLLDPLLPIPSNSTASIQGLLTSMLHRVLTNKVGRPVASRFGRASERQAVRLQGMERRGGSAGGEKHQVRDCERGVSLCRLGSGTDARRHRTALLVPYRNSKTGGEAVVVIGGGYIGGGGYTSAVVVLRVIIYYGTVNCHQELSRTVTDCHVLSRTISM